MTDNIKAPYAHKYFHRRIEPSDDYGPLIGHDHFDPIDWDKVVREADWEHIREICRRAGGFPNDPDYFEGHSDGKMGIFVVPWHLSLTHADWQSIRRKCRRGLFFPDGERVFALHGNLVFWIRCDGVCVSIFRFAACENRYEAVEIAHLDASADFADITSEMCAELLALLLPGHRFGWYWSEIDDDGWYWREPGDPGYIAERKQPWTAFLRHWITLPEEGTEWVDLKLPDENGAPGGPLKWSLEQFRVVTDDPKLCQQEFYIQFLWEDNTGDRPDQEPILFILRNHDWLCSVHFRKCADGYIASRALTSERLFLENRYFSGSGSAASDIWEYINDLIDRKRQWKESRQRKKQL
jgi:hypothetical protein